MTAAAFKATFADWKLIKTRGCIQLVFEVPLHESDMAYRVVGGMPNAAEERWFAIARLTTEGRAATGLGERNSLCDDPTTAGSTTGQDVPGCPGSIPGPPRVSQSSSKTPAASMPARGAAKEEVDAAPRPQSNRLARQAAICCRDPVFRKYLQEIGVFDSMPNSIECADYVRSYCDVDSRKKIIVGSPAGAAWERLYSKFTVWKLVPA